MLSRIEKLLLNEYINKFPPADIDQRESFY